MNFLKRFILIILLCFLLVPALLVISIRFINPWTSAVIIQHNLSDDNSSEYINFSWVDYEDISRSVPLAVLAAEDQRFPNHFGIDFTELKRALEKDDGKIRGASTITQQVAKNLFLWQGRSLFRKAIEAWFAILMELFLPKQRILELYLNIAQMGNDIYGIERAAWTYFNKPSAALNLYESTRIAAVLPNPNIYSVLNTSDYVLKKQKHILEQTRRLGGYRYLDKLK